VSLLVTATATLTAWPAPTPGQDLLRGEYLAHLARHPDALWRAGHPTHLTASCFVLDPAGTQVLLTLHRRGGFWVQPGGHLEATDPTLTATALREATEECGVPGLRLISPEPVDLHRHALSVAFGRCHEHLDVAYLAVADREVEPVVSDESDDVRWWPVDALPAGVVPDLPDRLRPLSDRLSRTA
jgi:8-oxo-dGTP pyrophosphatase MutT (NUDIX family)